MISESVITIEAIEGSEESEGLTSKTSYKNEYVEPFDVPQESFQTENETFAMHLKVSDDISDFKTADNEGSFTDMIMQTSSTIQGPSFAATNVPELPKSNRSSIDVMNEGILKLQQEYGASTDKRAFIAELQGIFGLNQKKTLFQ